jgi:hypothetical protein
MDEKNDSLVVRQATILVASGDASFAELVGEMVTCSGFTAAYPERREAAWLALQRTRPRVVVCDCAAPADGIRRLIVEASARRLPLVLSDPRVCQTGDARARSLLHHVAWLTLPISRESFGEMLDALLASPVDATHRVRSAAAIAMDAARTVRPGPIRRDGGNLENRSPSDVADERDLRSVIAAALVATPIYERPLRRGVWIYVGAARAAGGSPGEVILSLTQLVDDANIVPIPIRQALMRCVMLWCVEAYFGHLAGAVADGEDIEMRTPWSA